MWETLHEKGIEGRERKEQYGSPNCSDTLEQSSYIHLTSSDWMPIEINILVLCLVDTISSTGRCPVL